MIDTAACKIVQCQLYKLTVYRESSRHSASYHCVLRVALLESLSSFQFITVRFSIATDQISVPMVDPFICGRI